MPTPTTPSPATTSAMPTTATPPTTPTPSMQTPAAWMAASSTAPTQTRWPHPLPAAAATPAIPRRLMLLCKTTLMPTLSGRVLMPIIAKTATQRTKMTAARVCRPPPTSLQPQPTSLGMKRTPSPKWYELQSGRRGRRQLFSKNSHLSISAHISPGVPFSLGEETQGQRGRDEEHREIVSHAVVPPFSLLPLSLLNIPLFSFSSSLPFIFQICGKLADCLRREFLCSAALGHLPSGPLPI